MNDQSTNFRERVAEAEIRNKEALFAHDGFSEEFSDGLTGQKDGNRP